MRIFTLCLLALSSCYFASDPTDSNIEDDEIESSSDMLLSPPERDVQPNPCIKIEVLHSLNGEVYTVEMPVNCVALEFPDRGDPEPNEMLNNNPSVQPQTY